MASPVLRAHQTAMAAEGAAFAGKWETAMDLHKKSAELFEAASELTKDPSSSASLRTLGSHQRQKAADIFAYFESKQKSGEQLKRGHEIPPSTAASSASVSASSAYFL